MVLFELLDQQGSVVVDARFDCDHQFVESHYKEEIERFCDGQGWQRNGDRVEVPGVGACTIANTPHFKGRIDPETMANL